MTQKKALQDLLVAIEAGGDYDAPDAWMPWICIGDRGKAILPKAFQNVPAAYRGSMDAAMALHDAVLPDQSVRIKRLVSSRASVARVAWLDNTHQGINDCPARAWIIAIIKALIAKAKE